MSKIRIATERKIKASFGLMMAVLFFLTFLSYLNNKRYEEASSLVTHTNQVLYHSEQILSAAIDLETGQRGYLITGDRIFLEHYEVAKTKIIGHIAKLKSSTLDNPIQQKRIDTLLFLTNRRLKLLETIVNLRRTNATITETMTAMSYESKSLLDNFRIVLRNCQTEENELLNQRMLDNEQETNSFNSTLVMLVIFILITLVSSYWIIHRHLLIRENNERTIRGNWQMLQSILDNTNSIIYIKDLDGKYTLVNKKFASYLNREPSELIGKSVFDLTDEKNAQIITEKDKKVIENETFIEYEETINNEKTNFISITSKFPLRNENQEIYAICGIVTDITEIRKAEEQLTYRSYMIDNASDAIVASDLKMNINFWNKAAQTLFGYTAEETFGKPYNEVLKTDLTDEQRQEQFKEFISTGTYTGELNFYTKENKKITTLSSCTSILNKSNQTIGYLIITKDISERKKTEEQLQQLNKELEAFTYSVSHDLRAPLRSIHGYSRILLEDYYNKVDDDGKKTINVIVNNTVRMGKLIDDLLAFSRTGRQDISQNTIHMNDLVKLALADFENGIDFRLAKITILDLPNTRADFNMIKQVWINLIGNALKYSSKSETPVIEIGSYSDSFSEIYYIKDNGVGYEQKYAHKLFEVFQRLHRLDQFEGTGVGLALVKKIIDKHNGKVWSESKVNEGATFYFSLPKYKLAA